jgi:phosphatidylglycerophosphatase A
MKISKFFYTGFGSGLSPVAPGTFGTLVGALLCFLEYRIFGDNSIYVNIAVIILFLYPAIKLGDIAERDLKSKDPQMVVLDEIFGYFFAVLFFTFTWKIAIAAFLLFRFFDILKPYPICRLQNCKGGFGIFIDDVVAGIFSNIVLWITVVLLDYFGITFF